MTTYVRVGHNEPNGLYKCFVTVNALPEHGPCYLVCGPYKMVVKEPSEYCFPLMDFVEAELQDTIYFSFEYNGLSTWGSLSIDDHHYCPFWPYCTDREDCPYYHGNNSNSTNDTNNASTP